MRVVPNWREIQKENFTHLDQLADFLELSAKKRERLSTVRAFPLNLPLRLARKIEKNNLDDPLFLQFVPTTQEENDVIFTSLDPTQDHSFQKEARLLQKYKGRALLLMTSACAMHCRYCFRQHFQSRKTKSFEEELNHLANDSSIEEVILSGGDPLSLDNSSLKSLISELEKMSHLKRLRFHTRFPIGIPERIDEGFLSLLASTRLQVIIVLHINHPQELDEDIFSALKKIQRLGIPILTQSVLLKGVNDSLNVLKSLFLSLIDHGILPYYLHRLDPVKGASHFDVEEEKGKALIAKLSEELPGYGVPKFVQEVPFKKNKQIL